MLEPKSIEQTQHLVALNLAVLFCETLMSLLSIFFNLRLVKKPHYNEIISISWGFLYFWFGILKKNHKNY